MTKKEKNSKLRDLKKKILIQVVWNEFQLHVIDERFEILYSWHCCNKMNGAHTCHFHMLSMMSKAFFSFSFISLPLSLYIFYTSLILSFLVSSYNPSLPLLSLSWLSSHLFLSLIFLAPSPSFCLSLTPHSCFIILDVGHNFG